MVYLISQSLRNWMDVSTRARYYLLTKKNGGIQGQHAENFVCDNPTTTDYMHVHTILVFLLRPAILSNPAPGLAHHTVDALVILRRQLTIQT
eukprot:1506141-Pyramimonas_sp.AAC.1